MKLTRVKARCRRSLKQFVTVCGCAGAALSAAGVRVCKCAGLRELSGHLNKPWQDFFEVAPFSFVHEVRRC